MSSGDEEPVNDSFDPKSERFREMLAEAQEMWSKVEETPRLRLNTYRLREWFRNHADAERERAAKEKALARSGPDSKPGRMSAHTVSGRCGSRALWLKGVVSYRFGGVALTLRDPRPAAIIRAEPMAAANNDPTKMPTLAVSVRAGSS